MCLTYEKAVNLLSANQQLQSLEIQSYFELSINAILHSIRKNSSLTQLTVDIKINGFNSAKDVSMDELNRFVDAHPLITGLELKCYRLTADDANPFICQMKTLKRFEFQVEDRRNFDRIVNQSDNEWNDEILFDEGKFYVNLNRWKMDFICNENKKKCERI